MRLLELFDKNPPITLDQLQNLEAGLDILFSKLDIDVDITNHHFRDRVNDPRNGEQITIAEISKLFKHVYSKYGDRIKQLDSGDQAILTDLASRLNIPIIKRNDTTKQMDHLHAKTIMRTTNFAGSQQKLFVNTRE